MRKIALVAIMLATALSAFASVSPAKAKGPPLSAALANPNVCWQYQGKVLTGAQVRGLIDPTLADPEARASVEWNGSVIWLHYYGAFDRSRHIDHFYKIPCPGAEILRAVEQAASRFTGLIFGGSFGALNGNSGFTNQQQFTRCPPFCTPDLTPNPFADLNSGGFRGGLSAGYNVALPNIAFGNPLILGVQGFYDFGSSTSTIPGIPGTYGPGGITTPAIAANDSTSVKFGNNAGILGKVGTVFNVYGMPVMIGVDGGVGFQRIDLTLNCSALGACGANGIPGQSLTDSQTRTGGLIGAEVNAPLLRLFVLRPEWEPYSPIVGFRYLHGDYGNVSTTLGNPTQIQIIAKQHVTTDSFMGTLNFHFHR
jgi:hypothetical protein